MVALQMIETFTYIRVLVSHKDWHVNAFDDYKGIDLGLK